MPHEFFSPEKSDILKNWGWQVARILIWNRFAYILNIMNLKVVLALLLTGLIFMASQNAGAQKSKKVSSRLTSLTGKVMLLEPHFFSSTIQVKKTGKKGGLQSVRAIVNSKTETKYKGAVFPFKNIPLYSTVRLEYERANGIIVARTITVKKLYTKPVPSKKKGKNKLSKKKINK
ncbi:MAG: hypothetical protein ACYDBV_07925 [Nitrospiria bacterium]